MFFSFGLIVLMFALSEYSNNKNIFKLGNSNMAQSTTGTTMPSASSSMPNNVSENKAPRPSSSSAQPMASSSMGQSSSYTQYNSGTSARIPTSSTSTVANDLLPDPNSQWQNAQPTPGLQNIAMLDRTHTMGTTTTNRNANLQIRSEPANPRTATNCPWNISTIEADTTRRPLEIGS